MNEVTATLSPPICRTMSPYTLVEVTTATVPGPVDALTAGWGGVAGEDGPPQPASSAEVRPPRTSREGRRRGEVFMLILGSIENGFHFQRSIVTWISRIGGRRHRRSPQGRREPAAPSSVSVTNAAGRRRGAAPSHGRS